VVVEGYKKLKCECPQVGELLESKENADALRRLRNAVFHCQKDPIDKRLIEFMAKKESEKRVKSLHDSFEKFSLPIYP
jgi:hypothetical protein